MAMTATSSASRKPKRGGDKSSAGPARPSRLLPSEPLHMTTRRQSKVATHSAANSVTSGGSRRASINSSQDSSRPSSQDGEDSRPRKRARTASTKPSESGIATEIDFADMQMADDADNEAADMSRTNSQDSTDSLKRKRASVDAEPTDLVDDVPAKTNGAVANNAAIKVDEERADIVNNTQVFHAQQPTRRSTRTRQSLERAAIVSAPSSAAPSPQQSADGQDELDPDDSNAVAGATTTGVAQPKKQQPGRRRQPHPDPMIEAALRYQLQLKVGFRSAVKTLKVVAAELAGRDIDRLEDDPDAHETAPEYQTLMAELDRTLEEQLARISKETQIQNETLERQSVAEEHILREQCAIQVKDIMDAYETRCEYRLLEVEHQVRREWGASATETQYDIVPPGAYPRGIVAAKHDSRSRVFIATERQVKAADRRFKLEDMRLQFMHENPDFAEADIELDDHGFATYDLKTRAYARSVHATRQLHAAANAVEDGMKAPLSTPVERAAQQISNDEATSLQVLAEASATAKPLQPKHASKASRQDQSSSQTTNKAPSREIKSSPTLTTQIPHVENDHTLNETPLPVQDIDDTPASEQWTPKGASRVSQPGQNAHGDSPVPPSATPKLNRINDLLNQDEPAIPSRAPQASHPANAYPLTNGYIPPPPPILQQPPAPPASSLPYPSDPHQSSRTGPHSQACDTGEERPPQLAPQEMSWRTAGPHQHGPPQYVRRSPEKILNPNHRDLDQSRYVSEQAAARESHSREDRHARNVFRPNAESSHMAPPPNRRSSIQHEQTHGRSSPAGANRMSPGMRDIRPTQSETSRPGYHDRGLHYADRRPSSGPATRDNDPRSPSFPPHGQSQAPPPHHHNRSHSRDPGPGPRPFEPYGPHPPYPPAPPYGHSANHPPQGPPFGYRGTQQGPHSAPPQGPAPPPGSGPYQGPYQSQFPQPHPQNPLGHSYPPPPAGSPVNRTPYPPPPPIDPTLAQGSQGPQGPPIQPGQFQQHGQGPPPSPRGSLGPPHHGGHPPQFFHPGPPPSFPHGPSPQQFFGPTPPSGSLPPRPHDTPSAAYHPPPPPPSNKQSSRNDPSRPPPGRPKRKARNSRASNNGPSPTTASPGLQPPPAMQTQFSIHPQAISGRQPLLPAPSDARSPVVESPVSVNGPTSGNVSSAGIAAAGRTTFQQHVPKTQGPTSGEQVLPKKRHRQYTTVPGTIFREYKTSNKGT